MEFDVIRTPFSSSEVMEILGISKEAYDDLSAFGLLRKSAMLGGRCSDQTNQHNFMDILHLAVWSRWSSWKAVISLEDLDELLTILEEEEFLGLAYEGNDIDLNQFCQRLFPRQADEYRELHVRFLMAAIEICKVIQSVFRASLSVLEKSEETSIKRVQAMTCYPNWELLKRYIAI